MSIKYNGGYIPAVGADGTTLVANSASATGVAWAGPTFTAGKNKIINGDFGIWQRGTSFTNPSSLAYTADRYAIFYDGTGATRTISQQTFTPGTAPVAGYEGKFFYRYAVSVAGTSNTANLLRQYIEDVRTFAGQTVTVSFWAKAASSMSIASVGFTQNFGTGGSVSSGVDTVAATSIAVTTSWQRFSYTVAVPSLSGKTIGTNNDSALELRFFLPSGASTFTFDTWGWQVEAGSVATAFQTATGTLQGELTACQRYYFQSETTAQYFWSGNTASGLNYYTGYKLPTTMRVAPTVSLVSQDNSNFPSTAGTVLRITTNTFIEARVSNATANGSYFGSSVIASAEL